MRPLQYLFASTPRNEAVGQYRHERRPWSDLITILLGHHARDLRDMTEIMNNPRREQLSEGHRTESRMDSRELQLRFA